MTTNCDINLKQLEKMFSFMSYNEDKVIKCVEQRVRASCSKINSKKNFTLQGIDRSMKLYQQKLVKEEETQLKQREFSAEKTSEE